MPPSATLSASLLGEPPGARDHLERLQRGCGGGRRDIDSSDGGGAMAESTAPAADTSLGLALRNVLAGKAAAAKHVRAGRLSSSRSIAAASVILSLELVRIAKELDHHTRQVHANEHSMLTTCSTQCRQVQQLEDLLFELHAIQTECSALAVERMLVYGLLAKEGHRRRSIQLRMFLLEGDDVSYFKLDRTTLQRKGSFPLSQIVSVTRGGSRRAAASGWGKAGALARQISTIGCRASAVGSSDDGPSAAETALHHDYSLSIEMAPSTRTCRYGGWHRSYQLFAPDESSRDVWESALSPLSEGGLMCCESIWTTDPSAWRNVRGVLHTSQVSLTYEFPTSKASLERLAALQEMKAKVKTDGHAEDSKAYLELVAKTRAEMLELKVREVAAARVAARGDKTGTLSQISLADVQGLAKQTLRVPASIAADGVAAEFQMITLLLKSGTLHLREAAGGQQRLEDWFGAVERLVASRVVPGRAAQSDRPLPDLAAHG